MRKSRFQVFQLEKSDGNENELNKRQEKAIKSKLICFHFHKNVNQSLNVQNVRHQHLLTNVHQNIHKQHV